MLDVAPFELLREEKVAEINSVARLYRHRKTGAELLSIQNDDENKVFGITFRTPPEDSTGVAHILEHSVLCGSRKYPVKKPFVELLKGSLQTFLNAMTYPDKTVYPVASQNLQDFYNLVDVYLDAVLFPLISEDTFRQEGWHYELDATQGPLAFKGVVFNEMKGAYSSPAAVLSKASQISVFPDNTYGINSGGDPTAIPDLTYDYFKNFHARYYHPSNARIVFYGDDDEATRLKILEGYLGQFERIEIDSSVKPQPRFTAPRKVSKTYAAGPNDSARTSMITINWMLDQQAEPKTLLALNILAHVLIGTPASPLRKAMIDSGLGEGLTGSGLADDYLQPMFTLGMKGIDAADGDKVEALVLDTMAALARDGIARETIAASLNSFEFSLRENNTGSFPRGISLMLRSLQSWLHDGDPIEPLTFEDDLAAIKADFAAGKPIFEDLLRAHLIENQHRTTVLLTPDTEQAAREAADERARLDAAREAMSPEQITEVAETTRKLKALQEAVDSPEQLAKIPTLTLADLPRQNKLVPMTVTAAAGVPVLLHELPTSGIVYADIGMSLDGLDPSLLPYLPLFSRALFQTGTSKEDFVSLSQRIGTLTGGLGAQRVVQARFDGPGTAAYLFVRGKAVPARAGDMLGILTDVLLDADLGNRERFLQMALEAKAGMESGLAGMGNSIVNMRLRAALNPADWANEQTSGVSYLFFLRDLIKRIESDWSGVQKALEAIRLALVNRAGMVVNVTTEASIWKGFAPQLESFLQGLPTRPLFSHGWPVSGEAASEGLTMPAQVNYVAKGGDLRASGFVPSGATAVAMRHLNTTYLWDKVRVQGGAYGGSSSFDPTTGIFTFLSYRDPNLLDTIKAYDGASAFLTEPIGQAELTRSIIGVIGGYDSYQLPDAKGFSSAIRYLSGNTDALRQQRRDEVLGAGQKDFAALAEALSHLSRSGRVVVLGSETAIAQANQEAGNFLKVQRVL